MVPVALLDRRTGNLICGGTILDRTTVVTAAHCIVKDKCRVVSDKEEFHKILEATDANHDIVGYDVKKLKKCKYNMSFVVQAGVTDLKLKNRSERRLIQRRWVSTLSPAVNYFNFHNDVALLTVQPPFEFNGVVRPACLPNSSLPINPGDRLTVTGFGSMFERFSHVRPKRLKKTHVHFVGANECNKALKNVVSANMLCAGNRNKGTGTCSGDSGSPIGIDNRDNNTFTVIGVAAYIRTCNPKRKHLYPDVYTDLRPFIDNWIGPLLRWNRR